jgi:TonB family protein
MLLILVSFSVPPQPNTDEGILVNFGTGETGMGDIEPSPPAMKEDASPPLPAVKSKPTAPPASTAKKSAEEPLLSQKDEEAPVVKKVDPEAIKKKLEKAVADKKIREQEQADRIIKQQEEIERKRVAAEQKRQSDIMNRTKNALANSKNSGTNSTGEGIAGGPGNQGDPNGSVDSKVRGVGSGTGTKGISYSLEGRGAQALPSPKYDYQGEGRVVVEVIVDKSGKVIQATPGVKGSTILDDYLLKVAKDAAMEARFQSKGDAPAIQKGTITYNFKLK